MSEALTSALAATNQLTQTGEGNPAVDGFHGVHVCGPAGVPAVAEVFRAQGYYLEMVTAQDRRFDDLGCFRLVYTFNRLGPTHRQRLHVDLKVDEAAPSIVGIYAGADWMEREVYDMYGVRFDGHPELKRILLPEDTDFFALRKDFGRMDEGEDEGEEEAEDVEGET